MVQENGLNLIDHFPVQRRYWQTNADHGMSISLTK